MHFSLCHSAQSAVLRQFMQSTTIRSNFDTLRCDCSLVGCGCCVGFAGDLMFEKLKGLDSSYSLNLLSQACSAVSCTSINNTNGKKLDEI